MSGQRVTHGIVGARFRPPAAGLLSVLGTGAALTVRREPDNPYDANALQVLVSASTLQGLPPAALQASCEGFGFGVSELLAQPEWHLGYVPREAAEHLAGDFESTREVPASLAFDLQGRPAVSFIVP